MQLLSQTRFRLLSKRQNQVYREQCDNLINDIQLVQEITETRLQKKITTQFNNLEHLRSENFRLLNVIQEKEEKCNTLLRSADDIKEIRKLIVKFNRDLEQYKLEQAGKQRAKKGQDAMKNPLTNSSNVEKI